jgi:hypothetical protein
VTAGLGYLPSQSTPPSDPRTKNVYKTPKRLGFRWLDTSALGFVGSGFQRERLAEKFKEQALSADSFSADLREFALLNDAASEKGGEKYETKRQAAYLRAKNTAAEAEAADAALASLFAADKRTLDSARPMSDAEYEAWQRDEFADLDQDHTADRLIDHLPGCWKPYLERMSKARRKERETAILDKVGWQGVGLLTISPDALILLADTKAYQYAQAHPAKDEKSGEAINQDPHHKRRRTAKWWRSRLGRDQKDALVYIEAAIGAVGGKNVPGRPLNASDFSIEKFEGHRLKTKEILGKSWLVCEDDPTIQIPMLEVDRKSRKARAAETRTLMDMLLHRWKTLGWHVCWITVTLPGRYVCHATNEENRTEEWDTRLGPKEALAALQDDHHRVLACLREKNVRPQGWWNAQPQQSGSPHRHYVLAVPTIEDARKVCDAFRDKFSSRKSEDDTGIDRGCGAFVIGDTDPKYKPRAGRNGNDETAESVARYAARYAARFEDDDDEGEDDNGDAGDGETGSASGTGGSGNDDKKADTAKKPSDAKRYAAWKWLRGLRTMGWLGFDSQRSPVELWRTHWNNARLPTDKNPNPEKNDPLDPRMALTVRLMRRTKQAAKAAQEFRETAKGFEPGDPDARADLDDAIKASENAACEAWHAAIAVGLWADTDLDPAEREWLREELRENTDFLPPMPYREDKENDYGEWRKVVLGGIGVSEIARLERKAGIAPLFDAVQKARELGAEIKAPKSGRLTLRTIRTALLKAGIGAMMRPDGTLAVFQPDGEILLKTPSKWIVTDEKTATEMREKYESEMDKPRENGKKDNPDGTTDETTRKGFGEATNFDMSDAERWQRNATACAYLKQLHGDDWNQHYDAFDWDDADWVDFEKSYEIPEKQKSSWDSLSDSPTDPRVGASPPPSAVFWPPGYKERLRKRSATA